MDKVKNLERNTEMKQRLNETTANKMYLIQVFRGISAILVLLFHLTEIFRTRTNYVYLGGLFNQGNSGVDFFFVLSGFIIYFAHNKDIGNPKKIKKYILKRFIRIYPTYWVALLIVMPIYLFITTIGDESSRNLISIIRAFTLIPLTNANAPFIVVAWSMSFEVLFYCLFGIIIILKPKISYILLTIWIISTILFSINMQYPLGLPNNYILNFLFSPFVLEFLTGCLIGYLVTCKFINKHGIIIMTVGIILYISICFFQQKYFTVIDLSSIRQLIYGLPFAFIIAGAAIIDIHNNSRIIMFFSFLGDASYSIYLTHYPIILILFKLAFEIKISNYIGIFLTATFSVIFTIIFGCIFHLIIEKPIIQLFRNRLITKPAKINKSYPEKKISN